MRERDGSFHVSIRRTIIRVAKSRFRARCVRRRYLSLSLSLSLSLFIGEGSRCEIFQKRRGNTKQPPRVPIGLLRLLDQNWITFLVNSLRRRGYNAGGGRGGREGGEGKGMKRAGRKERHGQSRRNESGLLLRRVSKFPTRAAAATARLEGVGEGRAVGLV